MPWAPSAGPAIGYFYGGAAMLVGLNIIPVIQGHYDMIHAVYTAVLVMCMLPMLVHLLYPSERLPFFPMICLLYGMQYAMFPFFGITPDFAFEYLTMRDLTDPALLTLAGITMLVVGYYARPVDLAFRMIRAPRMLWDVRRAKLVAVAFLAVGLVGIGALKTGRVFAAGGQIIVFASNLAVVGVLALFLLQLRRQLSIFAALALWLGYVPLYILLSISGGNAAPIAAFLLALGLVYVGERRRIPWITLILALLVMFPFMFAKHEYRRMVWENGVARFATVDEALRNVETYASLAAKTATFGWEQIQFALHIIVVRFDISYIFAHVIRLSPSEVPYLNGESYSDVLWKVIPRVLMPDKPDPLYGQIFGHLYYILSADDFTTSINFPQMVEMYVNFGPAGVIVGMFLMAQLYRVLTRYLNQPGQGDWIAVFAASIFANQFRIESNFSLVVGGILYHTALLLILGFFIRSHGRRATYGQQGPAT